MMLLPRFIKLYTEVGHDQKRTLINFEFKVRTTRGIQCMYFTNIFLNFSLFFRSTADLEGFHQHILMYCAKRYAYTPPVYRARNRLAALDHNLNLDRAPIKNKDGSVR